MGIKNDLIIGGVIIAGIVLFKDQIAGGLSGAGAALGQGIGGLGTSFFDALKNAIPSTQTINTQSGTITAPANLPVDTSQVGDVTVTNIGGGGFAQAEGGTLDEQKEALDQITPTSGPGSLFDQLQKIFGGLLGPISGPTLAFAEEPQTQGPPPAPNTELDPNRPLDLFAFANKLGISPASAFSFQKNNPELFKEITQQQSIFEPVSGQSFEVFGSEGQSGSIVTNKPLTDIITKFKQLGFNLTASQAADIKAKLNPDEQVQNFDFGTNTGNALAILESGLNFGQGGQNIELQKAIEAARASANEGFGGTSNFANPDFPITLGESFLGKKGTVVSNDISNLTPSQLQEFQEFFA